MSPTSPTTAGERPAGPPTGREEPMRRLSGAAEPFDVTGGEAGAGRCAACGVSPPAGGLASDVDTDFRPWLDSYQLTSIVFRLAPPGGFSVNLSMLSSAGMQSVSGFARTATASRLPTASAAIPTSTGSARRDVIWTSVPAVVRSCPEERKVKELITMRSGFSNRSADNRPRRGRRGRRRADRRVMKRARTPDAARRRADRLPARGLPGQDRTGHRP